VRYFVEICSRIIPNYELLHSQYSKPDDTHQAH
jgi:hypothetical protein